VSNKKIAKHLARKIFEIGSDPDISATRIEFKGRRKSDGREIGLGGFIESALASCFERLLDEISNAD